MIILAMTNNEAKKPPSEIMVHEVTIYNIFYYLIIIILSNLFRKIIR